MLSLAKRPPLRLEWDAEAGKLVPRARTAETPEGALAVTILPAGQIDFDLASTRAALGLRRLAEGGEALSAYGVAQADGAGVMADLIERAPRVGTAALSIELGCALILGWEGVGLPTGEKDLAGDDILAPAEKTREAVTVLMNAWVVDNVSFGAVFLGAVAEAVLVPATSKKGSAASPGSPGAAAASIAKGAPLTATTAPPAG